MTNPPLPGDDEQVPQTPSTPTTPPVPEAAPAAPAAPEAAPAATLQAPQAAPAAPQYPQAAPAAPQYQQQAQPAYGEPGPGGYFDGAVSPDDLSRPLYGATFGQAVRRFFKNYTNFKGRASRSEFWYVQLFQAILLLLPLLVTFIGTVVAAGSVMTDELVSYDDSYEITSVSGAGASVGFVLMILGAIVSGIISLGLLIPMLAIHWRRLHDANFAGPFYFLSLTSVGAIVVLVFTILPSKVEGRRFDVAR